MNPDQQRLLDHYKNPRNYGKPGWSTEHSHTSSNKVCGDEITMYLDISDEIVRNIRFVGVGCSICIASASILTELAQNKSLREIRNMKDEELIEHIGISLNETRKKCATLGLDSLNGAMPS